MGQTVRRPPLSRSRARQFPGPVDGAAGHGSPARLRRGTPGFDRRIDLPAPYADLWWQFPPCGKMFRAIFCRFLKLSAEFTGNRIFGMKPAKRNVTGLVIGVT